VAQRIVDVISTYDSLTGRVGRKAETIQKRASGKLAGLITWSRLVERDWAIPDVNCRITG
jgi:hypothetical protein